MPISPTSGQADKTDSLPGFSIIIPVKEINDFIKESVPIILQLDYSKFEIIILPNDSPQNVPSFLCDSKIKIVPSGTVSPAIKRDLGASCSQYEYLAFLDDDAYPQKDWLKVAAEQFALKEVAAIGGPGVTPHNNSIGQQASGLFFETLIGGGGLDYRYRPAKTSFYVDDFPTVNFIVRKKQFDAIGGFDNNYWPGEDTKFCLDLVNAGYKIWYSKDLVVYHHRRHLIGPHLLQVGNYGKHRGYFAKKFPGNSRKLVYFCPSLFLIGNFVCLIGSFIRPEVAVLWLIGMSIYFLIAIGDVFYRTKNISIGLLTISTILLSHLTYGYNFLRGLFSSKAFKSQLR